MNASGKTTCYRVCRVRCKRCGDVLEYVNLTKADNGSGLIRCSCGKVALDPSPILYRIIGASVDYEDLSEEWDEDF